MLTPDLRKYLDGLKTMSVAPTDETIREVLLGVGWNDESIGDAIRFFHETKVSPPTISSPSGFITDSTIPQKNPGSQISIPINVAGIDFIDEGDSVLSNEDERGEVVKQKAVPPPVSLQSTADAGRSSQSVLYPDNSSRLGMGGQSMIQSPVFSPAEEKKREPENKPKEGPPLMDLDTLASQVPDKETIEKTIEGVSGKDNSREDSPLTSFQVQKPFSAKSEQPVQTKVINRLSPSLKAVSSVDGVRPSFARQQIQNPTRPVSIPQAQKNIPVPQRMPDVRPPELVAPKKINSEEPRVSAPVLVKERSSRRFVTRVGFFAVVLGVLAATVYAYMTGLGPFASAGPYQQISFASDFAKGLTSIKTAVVTASYDLSFVERGKKTKPVPILASGATTTLSYFFPGLSLPVFKEGDAQFGLSLSGNVKKDEVRGVDFSVGLEGVYGGGGQKIDGEIELIRIGTSTYFQIKKTPELAFLKTLFGDLSKIEGIWVDAHPTSSSESIIETWAKKLSDTVDSVGKVKLLNAFARALDQEKVISFAKPPSSIDSWKGPATRYTLAFDFTRFAAFMRRMANDSLTSDGAYSSFADNFGKIASALERSDATPLLAYLSDNALMTVDVGEDGIPLAVAFTSRMAPSSETGIFADKELKAVAAVTLTDMSQGVDIKVPAEVISLEGAAQKMMGLSSDEYLLSLQLQRVSAIAQAIDTFSEVVGRLPKSLDELLKTGGDFKTEGSVAENTSSVLRDQYETRPFLPFVPVDVSTGESFFYGVGVKGDDYNLAYEVSLPPIREGALPYMSPWAYQFLTVETKPKGNGYAWRIVDGENTVTKTMFSLEGKVYR